MIAATQHWGVSHWDAGYKGVLGMPAYRRIRIRKVVLFHVDTPPGMTASIKLYPVFSRIPHPL
jgi:hypothetical protein